jgi:hypothetical protein
MVYRPELRPFHLEKRPMVLVTLAGERNDTGNWSTNMASLSLHGLKNQLDARIVIRLRRSFCIEVRRRGLTLRHGHLGPSFFSQGNEPLKEIGNNGIKAGTEYPGYVFEYGP